MIVLEIILSQMAVTCVVNGVNGTRIPKDWKDLLKLTFLPFVLINLKKIRQ